MKKEFLEPEIEVSHFELADILTTSDGYDPILYDDDLGWF